MPRPPAVANPSKKTSSATTKSRRAHCTSSNGASRAHERPHSAPSKESTANGSADLHGPARGLAGGRRRGGAARQPPGLPRLRTLEPKWLRVSLSLSPPPWRSTWHGPLGRVRAGPVRKGEVIHVPYM